MKRVLGLLGVLLLAAGVSWADTKDLRLGDVARKVRAERARRDLSEVPYFTNESLPKGGTISTLGAGATSTEAAPAAVGEGAAAGGEAGPQQPGCGEQCWRTKFSDQRTKIATAQRELDLLQREYDLARTQYYQDPNQAVREQYSNTTAGGRQLEQLLQRINDKKAEIQRLQQELAALEDQLRREGGNPGWAR